MSLALPGSNSLRKLAVVHEMEARSPNIFGARGGSARAFAMCEVGFDLGLTVGPSLSGILFETIGYYYMSFTLGEFRLLLIWEMSVLILLYSCSVCGGKYTLVGLGLTASP